LIYLEKEEDGGMKEGGGRRRGLCWKEGGGEQIFNIKQEQFLP